MYHVPSGRNLLINSWKVLLPFILKSSFIIALLSALLMTGRYMLRYNDFFALGNIGLFILITIYCFILGVLLSTSVNSVTLLLLASFTRPLPQWYRTVVYSLIALVASIIIWRVTWYSPAPGEEADDLNRFLGRVVTPCLLHIVAIVWGDYRRNRPPVIDPSIPPAVVMLDSK